MFTATVGGAQLSKIKVETEGPLWPFEIKILDRSQSFVWTYNLNFKLYFLLIYIKKNHHYENY